MAKKNILLRSKIKKANALLEANQLDSAASIFLQLKRTAPMDVDVYFGLGFIESRQGNNADAVKYFEKAASIQPNNPHIQYHLGIALKESGDFESAATVLGHAARLSPGHIEALNGIADAYMKLGNVDQSISAYKESLLVDPGNAGVYANLGNLYLNKGLLREAESCYRKAVSLKPGIPVADNIGSVLSAQGKIKEAIDVYHKALVRHPNDRQLLSNMLLTLNYVPHLDRDTTFKEHKRINSANRLVSPERALSNTPDPDRRLRIGYVSPDFREHSVAYFIEPILEMHRRSEFEVHGYSSVPKPDLVTERLESSVDHWVNISKMSPDQVADKVQHDQIDILVDLAGHTAHNSLDVFSLQPAPIQITYLGYPNTTGLDTMHYRFVDEITDPPDQDLYYTEQLLRLPGCFLCYKPPEGTHPVSPLPAKTSGRITFGSFNNLSKINEEVVKLWADIIKAVPGSHLLIKNPSLTDKDTRLRYLKSFMEHGLEETSIELTGHTPTREEHLHLYSRVDIALDTLPYNGTTTTCEALWMGVPVITLTGSNHASRVGTSLLRAVGHNEWVAASSEDYIDIARRLSASYDNLAAIRLNLRDSVAGSDLCAVDSFMAKLEPVYRNIWSDWCANQVTSGL
ncbi:tetratricopeptide repeat protein [Pseudomonadota bacterium]